MNNIVQADITYLEQYAPPQPGYITLQPPYSIASIHDNAAHYMRLFYQRVGKDFLWWEKYNWSDDDFAQYLAARHATLYYIYDGAQHIGGALCEWFHDDSHHFIGEIAYFGLYKEWTGQKIGLPFLYDICSILWQQPINKALVNTCLLDHPSALATYQKVGFTIINKEERRVTIPPLL